MKFSLLAEEIAKSHKSKMGDFIGVIVEGKPRIGKSVYATKVMRDVHMILDSKLSKLNAYELARQSLHFHLEPFLKTIQTKQREIREMLPKKIDWTRRIPVIGIDDASLYAGTDLYFRDPNLYAAFQRAMTTIGTSATSVLITAPTHDALAKCLREYYDYFIVSITNEGQNRRLAKIKEWYKHGQQKKLRAIGEDEFTARIPTSIYGRYLIDRMDLGGASIDELLRASASREKANEAPRANTATIPKKDRRRRTKLEKVREIYDAL